MLKLKRIRFGPLELKSLSVGAYRNLGRFEVKRLKESLGLKRN